MSETDARPLHAAPSAGWRSLIDRFAAFDTADLLSRIEGDVPIVAIDVSDDTVLVRRFSDGTVTEIARLPRAGLSPAALHAAVARELDRPWYLRPSFALRLPPSSALERTLSLPLAARRSLANLLGFELDRQSPIDPREVYHDYSVLERRPQDGTMRVAWRLFRRRDVDPLMELCGEAGIEPAVIALVSDEVPASGGTFPVAPGAARALRLRRLVAPALVLAIGVLLAAVTANAYWRNQEADDMLLARVDEARGAARVALDLEHRIDVTRSRAGALVAEKRQAAITRILAEVTRLLPDGTWLTDFSVADGEVRLRGNSNKASSLIGVFDGSALFANAEFRAPLVEAQDGSEQFDLAVKMRDGAR
ncbi:MAG: PilN domain-containing protein [Alphaproteobacteria bacterium]|nr:PilN domain-containing protein [Alphaproteobacteria bacterium]MBL7098335.1 PilN domain-containing protein [Alphaproteobacteria bacterium]